MAQPAKHTPGPWQISAIQNEPEKVSIIDADMCFVAEVWQTYINGESRQQAHAALIAAAPAMYAELVNGLGLLEASYHDMCDKYGKDSMQAEVVWDQVERTRNVIAQAEGSNHA